jgi:hypothetical protein
MEFKTRKPLLRFAPAKAGFALAGLLPLLVAVQAQAVEFSFADDEITGSVDSTVSYGQLWRVQGRDKTNDDINANDGNRNFDTGLVSEVFKITTDAEAKYQNYGVFVRGTAFYDTQIMDKRNDYYDNNNPVQPSQSYPSDDHFTSETRDKAGNNAEILDAYVYGSWDIAEKPVSARLGKQVFNWGEGLFYRGGVNTTNPIDAAKFRLPGSELKEVLIPVEAFNFSVGLTDNLSMDAFYQFNFKETAIDPVGTFFSETDLFAAGGETAYTNRPAFSSSRFQGAYSTLVNGGNLLNVIPVGANFAGVQGTDYLDSTGTIKVASIGSDINAKNDGQFGLSFRYIAEELNSTEFGFYIVNYHAKEPIIHADVNDAYAGIDVSQLTGLIGHADYDALEAAAAAEANPNGINHLVKGLIDGAAATDVGNQLIGSREYKEDIRMYGVSFSTTLDETSVFGELAYRPNQPIGISTTNDLLGDLLGQAARFADGEAIQVAGESIDIDGQLSNGVRVEAFNTSLGTIQNFGPLLSFDSLFGVAELASEHYRADDLQYTAYNGQGRYYAGRQNSSYVNGAGRDSQINRDSYGYTLLLNGTWNDVYAGVNLSPYAVYKDDFEGNSSQTGNFIEGRKAYTIGLRASYLSSLEGELAYTEYSGAGQDNATRDRDNIGMNVKYSF